jgi:hypothetical protein
MDESSITKPLWTALELIVQLAWGAKGPASVLERQGWYDLYHLTTFCDLKELMIRHYGQERMNAFIDRQLRELPGARALPRNESWQRTILSIPCGQL